MSGGYAPGAGRGERWGDKEWERHGDKAWNKWNKNKNQAKPEEELPARYTDPNRIQGSSYTDPNLPTPTPKANTAKRPAASPTYATPERQVARVENDQMETGTIARERANKAEAEAAKRKLVINEK